MHQIQLLTETQQYSEAMKALETMKSSAAITEKLSNEVKYRLMLSRVYRLTGKYKEAMSEINKLPKLSNDSKLKLDVDFKKAALYSETPSYSMRERMRLIYPIINKGITNAKALNEKGMLASFYSLKASMHQDECRYIHRKCKENTAIARKYYIKAMDLFLEVHDTLNYHNTLNGLFRLVYINRGADIDSIKNLVNSFAITSHYTPNTIVSHSLLASYYIKYKHDSINYLKEQLLSSNARIDGLYKNRDHLIDKMKLLYQFESLKQDIQQKKESVAQKNIIIYQKNRYIIVIIVFSVVLFIILALLVFMLIKQRRLANKNQLVRQELEVSNHNFQLLNKESNHRIKNNLQMILSMIALDMEKREKNQQQLLKNISSKIATISALHKILDFKEHNQKVALKAYFSEIIEYFNDFTQNKIMLSTDFANPKIRSERIVYLGLILNELLSNTIEHRKHKEDIVFQVLQTDKNYIFIYRDNSNFGNFKKNKGINLIESLVERFGGDNFKFDPKIGEYKFYFDE